jgi:hypothetical protein
MADADLYTLTADTSKPAQRPRRGLKRIGPGMVRRVDRRLG